VASPCAAYIKEHLYALKENFIPANKLLLTLTLATCKSVSITTCLLFIEELNKNCEAKTTNIFLKTCKQYSQDCDLISSDWQSRRHVV